jgi:rod shape determining protein RodA
MYEDSYKRLGGLVLPLLLCLVPMALILKQPDLGTTLVLIPVAFAILLAAGARLWHLALVGLGGSGGLVLMWFTVMKDYQKARILAWLDPEAYRLREAYQLLLSRVAIGSGGFLGTWGDSKQSGLDLLPEKHTDFIFAVVAEQGGFLAAGTLLTVLFLMTLSGFGIALRTREPAGRLIAVGIATLLGGQALVNASVALGLLPTTGLTFPFVSYGGSSLISSFLCLGLLINIGSLRPPSFGRKN